MSQIAQLNDDEILRLADEIKQKRIRELQKKCFYLPDQKISVRWSVPFEMQRGFKWPVDSFAGYVLTKEQADIVGSIIFDGNG